MKFSILASLFVLTLATVGAQEKINIDWSSAVPIEEIPGIWDETVFKTLIAPRGTFRGSRIINGAVAVPHTHPYQVGLLVHLDEDFVAPAGGSIISARAILTAAHNIRWAIRCGVVLGAHQLRAAESSQQIFMVQQSNFRLHAQYDPETLRNDVAIMILPQAATFNRFVQLIALPPLGSTENFVGEAVIMSGWGRTETGSTATHLRFTRQTVISNALCQATFGPDYIVASNICATSVDNASTCSGDSGGPVTVERRGERIQIGLLSFGADGCPIGSPSAYARVTFYRQWINDNMNP